MLPTVGFDTSVAVVGAGSWGTTVAAILCEHASTTLWGRDADLVAEIADRHTNSRYLHNVVLPSALRATVDLPDGRRGCAERTVRSTIAEATLSATLTWTDDDADIDLYVTQPDDETSWYANRTTSIGGSLDRDDLSGYGPETYSLSADEGDAVLFGDYLVRVHYYSDHTPNDEPSRAVSWRVVIVVNEGTPEEERIIREGVLSVDMSSNSSPGSSGPDWADVATVTIPEPQPDPGG